MQRNKGNEIMRAIDFLSAFGLILALAPSFATAYDPSPLQDFCVAANDTNSTVFVNGKFCKDPSRATINDFLFAGLNVPRNTSNQLGVNITMLNVDKIPGLNTQGLTLARIDFAPNGGLNPPHYHPRASEMQLVLEGTLYAGFVTSNPAHRFFSKILHPGDVIVYPLGLIHFQWNVGNTRALAIATFNSQNPGVVTVANALFGANPVIDSGVLAKAFHLNKTQVESLQKQFWQNP